MLATVIETRSHCKRSLLWWCCKFEKTFYDFKYSYCWLRKDSWIKPIMGFRDKIWKKKINPALVIFITTNRKRHQIYLIMVAILSFESENYKATYLYMKGFMYTYDSVQFDNCWMNVFVWMRGCNTEPILSPGKKGLHWSMTHTLECSIKVRQNISNMKKKITSNLHLTLST